MATTKHLLFVDDDPLALQGLQRMLRPLRHEWSMTFVESGTAALALMAREPVDVVVSDMRMPGMNGAELLNEVMRRHPQTVRLILSGHADQDLILKCVGSTHQYLAKPCDADTLRATVRRAATLGGSLANPRVRRLVARMARVPSIPALYHQIVAALQQEHPRLDDVAAIVEQDPGMAAQILKLANSAFFGLRRQVASVREATLYLGLDTLKSLVLSLHAFAQYERMRPGGLSLPVLWNHSLKVADLGRRLGAVEGAPAKLVDEAFAGGLLHDVGKLVLAANFTEQYGQACAWARRERRLLVEAEQEVFGCTHAEVGGYLLGLWGLPVPVVEAIALHHVPGQTAVAEFSPLTAVHAANVLARAREDLDPEVPRAAWDRAYLERLQLAARIPVWESVAAAPG